MERNIGPRFHNQTQIPEVPQGMVLVKFHKEPVLIPEKEEGEPMYCGTKFTERQLKILTELECQGTRMERIRNLDGSADGSFEYMLKEDRLKVDLSQPARVDTPRERKDLTDIEKEEMRFAFINEYLLKI